MRSINNRYYFDYNATSPLAESVKNWLSKGDFPFANPASIHHSGKASKRMMNQVQEFMYKLFNLSDQTHKLYFHSGATEGIGNLIRGFFEASDDACFAYVSTDHSCVYQHALRLKSLGVDVLELQVDQNGNLEESAIVKLKAKQKKILLNWTWVNNETGVVFPLSNALEIKTKVDNCYIHVDAVQAPGKVPRWNNLLSELDAYTFSNHKYGALKGVGHTFVRQDLLSNPIILGGGQQSGLRSGTENTYGSYSSMLALEELFNSYNTSVSSECLNIVKNQLLNSLGEAGELVGACADSRNTNTLYIVFYNVKSDITSVAFDLANIDISTGSACSSGAILPSRVLLKMGYNQVEAKSAIRFSFSPKINKEDALMFAEKISSVVKRFSQK